MFLCWTLPLYGQDERQTDPFRAIFLTWGPVLVIIGLWIYFMRKFSGSQSFYQKNQELMVSIDARLERIADSLEGLVEEMKKRR